MPEGRRRLIQALGGMFGQKADKLKLVPALVGAYFNGQKTLKVAGRDDFIWARIRGGTSEVVQVFNDTVQAHWDLPILVYRDPNYPDIWKVYGRDISRYEDWGGINYIPSHADQHAFGGGRTGGDVVWVFKRQFMPLLPHPNATATMSIYVEPDFYYWDGGYVWFGGTGTSDLSGHKPTGGTNARYVSIYIDGDSGNLLTIAGDEFDAIWTPDNPSDMIPVPTPGQGVPIAAVLLMTGTSTIGWGEIFDIRNIVSALEPTGDLAFGSCYGVEIGWTQASAVQNTWYDISDAGMVDGELQDVTHDGNGQLTVTKAGKYIADWAGSFEADAANQHIQLTFSVNGTEGGPGMNHIETVAVSREQACSGNAILDLAANDTVHISIRTTDAGTPDLVVDHLMIRLVQIEGT